MLVFQTKIMDLNLSVYEDDKGYIAHLGRHTEFRNRSISGLMRIAYQMARNIKN